MQNVQTNLLARDDTFFGVCEALGEDLGINSTLFRIAFAVGLFFNPLAAIGGYAAAGILVALSRLLVPNPRPAAPVREADLPAAEPAAAAAGDEADRDSLPLAA